MRKSKHTPEPCISERCYSPTACHGFGYCRERNLRCGLPNGTQADAWREEARRRKFEAEGHTDG
jgi:hypothetical protein